MAMVEKTTLIAENVEVDMQTLGNAWSVRVNPFIRHLAMIDIVDAVIKALSPGDRERLEAYKNQENPCL